MDITGCDLVIFTFEQPREVFNRVVAAVLARWPGALIEDTGGPVSVKPLAELPRDRLPDNNAHVIFYRDAQMLQHMEDQAYTLMPDGDGPFAVLTRFRRDVDFEVSQVTELHAANHTAGGVRPPEPYPAWLCAPTVLEVTAVTPSDPDSSPFAAWVLGVVRRACRGAG